MLVYAGALNPVKKHIQFIKNKHPKDVKETSIQLRILVKDIARKLATSMAHESVKRRPGDHEASGDHDVMGSASK